MSYKPSPLLIAIGLFLAGVCVTSGITLSIVLIQQGLHVSLFQAESLWIGGLIGFIVAIVLRMYMQKEKNKHETV